MTVAADDPATTSVDEGLVKIIQVITLPTSPAQINSTSVFGASPEGSVTGTAGSDPWSPPATATPTAPPSTKKARRWTPTASSRA
ncbi:hypothetical protein [Deinococcus multiflagellatus]|uniref:Uncharacterized protein n=1 Tax=Deinococcus multiflagellatus TaxID=1656887 RepID=A0ABW1ZMG2_9DEIO